MRPTMTPFLKKFEEHFIAKRYEIHKEACVCHMAHRRRESMEAFIRDIYEQTEQWHFHISKEDYKENV